MLTILPVSLQKKTVNWVSEILIIEKDYLGESEYYAQ